MRKNRAERNIEKRGIGGGGGGRRGQRRRKKRRL